MEFLFKWLRKLRKLIRRAPLSPLQFQTTGFETVPDCYFLEEEQFDEFKEGLYYPVNIGDVYDSKYQVLGKLGFGTTSTVWLARNLHNRDYVALKVYTRNWDARREIENYDLIGKANPSHRGYRLVRKALDSFVLHRDGGDYTCLVLKPLWDSWKDLVLRNPVHRFPLELLKAGLYELLLALDYLHSECKLVHTDIKMDNILSELVDKNVMKLFTKAETEFPSPRKFVNGAPIFMSQRFERPRKMGHVVLSDFGSAVRGDQNQDNDAQPNVYRSPEVMLDMEWSYPVDIWNVGAMIWDVFEGKHLFYGIDPLMDTYTTRAHLAEVIGMLGLPPLDLIQRGRRGKEFFTEDGQWKQTDIPIPQDRSLESVEELLEGESKEKFLAFVRGMLQWRPEDRKTAKELLQDPWLTSF